MIKTTNLQKIFRTEEVETWALNDECGLIVNSSRGIIHASNGRDFATVAAAKAREMQQQMATLLAAKGII